MKKSFYTSIALILALILGTVNSIAGSFSIYVKDSNGNPLSGVQISYNDYGSHYVALGTTNATGTVLASLPDGTYKFRAFLNYSEQYVIQAATGIVQFQTSKFIVHVKDFSGGNFQGIAVSYNDYGSHYLSMGNTDVNGLASIELFAGTWKFRAYKDHTETTGNLTVSTAGSSGTIEFQTAKATGIVKDCNGTPLSGFNIYFNDYGSHWLSMGITGVDGKASIQLFPGTHKLRAYIDYTSEEKDLTLTLTESEVEFNPTRVTFQTGATVRYNDYGSHWKIMTSPFYLFSGIYDFKFDNQLFEDVKISGCSMNEMLVVIKLINSLGSGLAGGTAQYNLGGWQTAGITDANGEVNVLIDGSAATIPFRMCWEDNCIEKNHDISVSSTVVFQTVLVQMEFYDTDGITPLTGEGKVFSGSWKSMGNTPTISNDGGMEMLPANYPFRVYYLGSYLEKNQDIGIDPLVIFIIPISIITQPQDQLVCLNSPASFSVSASGNSLNYQWQKDGLDIPGANSNIFSISPVTLSDAGQYRCIVSNSSGSVMSDEAGLAVYQVTIVTFGRLPDLCSSGRPLPLTGGLPPGGIYSGPGVSSGIFEPSVAGAGTHTLTYSYTDGNGCTYTATQVITVFQSTLSTAITGYNVTFPGGNDGEADLTVSGGMPAYMFQWSNGAFTEDINGLTTGTYDVRVIDNQGCISNNSVVITEENNQVCHWCNKGAVLSQVWQNMGGDISFICAMPDIIVDLRMASNIVDPAKIGTDQPATGSLQAAVDYMNNNDIFDGIDDGDFNGDGYLFIGVIATDCEGIPMQCSPLSRSAAGDTPFGMENVVITNTHTGRMNIFGCSVTLHALDPNQPVITIQDAVGKLTVLDIHVKYSNAQGYLIRNNADLVVIKNSRAMFNDIGYDVQDDQVEITGSPQISDNRIGILVQSGPGNILRTNSDITQNIEYGILISGDGNESNGNEAGGPGKPNGTGIKVTGNNNLLHGDKAVYNNMSGVEISGDENEADNEDANNNGGVGILVSGNNNVINDCRQVRRNAGDGIKVTGHHNTLEGNVTVENGANGINADEADGANGNTLKDNEGNKNNLQGIRACGQIDLGDNKADKNGTDPQLSFSCPDPANAKFLVVDINTDKCYLYDATFSLISGKALASANSDANDATDDGTNTYVLDKNDKQVYRYVGTNAVSKVLKDISGGNLSTPSGLAISGNDMWMVDAGKKKIFRYSLSAAFSGSGSINALQQIAFTGKNANANGLMIDGSYLYVLDESDKQFYRYPVTGGTGVASKVMKDVSGGSLGTPSGAVIDGASVYVVDMGKDKVYQYNLASLYSGTGNLNASAQYALYNTNLNATGIAVGNSSNLYKNGDAGDQPEDNDELQLSEDIQLHVFPNPAKGNITVKFVLPYYCAYSLRMYDMAGRIVILFRGEASAGLNMVELDLSRLIQGMYLLEFGTLNIRDQKMIMVR